MLRGHYGSLWGWQQSGSVHMVVRSQPFTSMCALPCRARARRRPATDGHLHGCDGARACGRRRGGQRYGRGRRVGLRDHQAAARLPARTVDHRSLLPWYRPKEGRVWWEDGQGRAVVCLWLYRRGRRQFHLGHRTVAAEALYHSLRRLPRVGDGRPRPRHRPGQGQVARLEANRARYGAVGQPPRRRVPRVALPRGLPGMSRHGGDAVAALPALVSGLFRAQSRWSLVHGRADRVLIER
eukprot:2814569-Prymnesium_polylepis.1